MQKQDISILFQFLLFSSTGGAQNKLATTKLSMQANHVTAKVNVLNELASLRCVWKSSISLQLQARRNRTLLQPREMQLPELTQMFTLYHCTFTNWVWEIALALKYLGRWLYRFSLILSRYAAEYACKFLFGIGDFLSVFS